MVQLPVSVLGMMRAGLVLLVACGCALSKPPTHAEAVKDALPKATQVPPSWSATANDAGVANDWLRSFNDAGLDAMVAEAMANNLDLRQAVTNVEIARQSVVVVGSQLWPQVGGQLGGHSTVIRKTDKGVDVVHNSLEYSQVSWEPDLWGRLRAQRAASEASYRATALDYAFARQSLAATTAKSWYLAVETRQFVALAERAVETYTRLLALVRIRRGAGKVADLDVAEASANVNKAESELRVAEGLYSQSRRALEILIGRYPSAEIEIAANFAVLPPPVSPGLPSSLLERRPDVMAAERQILAAFRTTEAAKLALLPTISLDLEGGHLSDRLLALLHLNPWLLHGAIGGAMPIFEGGKLRAEIKIATAEQEATVAQYGSVVLRAFGEVEVGLTNERLLAQQEQFEERALQDRTAAVRIATIKYKAGTADLLSVLILQTDELGTQESLIKLRNARLANRIDLHLALGGSFDAAPAAKP